MRTTTGRFFLKKKLNKKRIENGDMELVETDTERAEGRVRYEGIPLAQGFRMMDNEMEQWPATRGEVFFFEEKRRMVRENIHRCRLARYSEPDYIRYLNASSYSGSLTFKPLSGKVNPWSELEDLVRWWGFPIWHAYWYVQDEWLLMEQERRAILDGPRVLSSTGVASVSTRRGARPSPATGLPAELWRLGVTPSITSQFSAELWRYAPLALEEALIEREVQAHYALRQRMRQHDFVANPHENIRGVENVPDPGGQGSIEGFLSEESDESRDVGGPGPGPSDGREEGEG